MRKAIALGIIFSFLCVSLAFAETSIKAEVDKKSITTDENITYKLVITSAEQNIPAPQVPKFEGFNILSQAQSSTVSFAGGGIKTILVYAFILAPTDVGKFKIEPSSVKMKDKTYSTDSIEIEVTQGKAKPRKKSEPQPSLPQQPQSETEQPQFTL